ncbi:hypothetical protein NNJEOMEG_02463 [Fundidesulfovibrio magnetotacticus]|uniref:Uncharacterized protein n=1 Tax=Fundidesulfovibrio magnetotacticus TaxID=2730080 RepID=A0A6V8LXS7_9BACT|nr:hypothetical protein [Fundidesulfovibrio magnetotacticus]GFK94616.1 hypothetical protein NNJEOMEG_02463 [Fundidesulfovibrio magnetotacticus]
MSSLTTTAPPYTTAVSDNLQQDARTLRAHLLARRLEEHLETMRQALEEARPLDALTLRPQALSAARLLREAVEDPSTLGMDSCEGASWSDEASLQEQRRAGLRDLERLRARLARLERGPWRTGADRERRALVAATLRRFAATALILALALGLWWALQSWRITERTRALEAARLVTAREALDLTALNAWQARRLRGAPLKSFLPDMSGLCAGLDLRAATPDHPCRKAWAEGRETLFGAATPPGGRPIAAPSEVEADPWGAPYVLLLPGDGPDRVASAGPDGLLGSADDLIREIP